MKKGIFTIGFLFVAVLFASQSMAQDKLIPPPGYQVDTRIDNMGYWQRMAVLGLVPVEPVHRVPPATFTGSKVWSRGVLVDDSPDVPVTTETNSTQSENSIAVDQENKLHVLNSNNSTPQPSNGSVFGTSWYYTEDGGDTWTGSEQGAGGSNSGDPAACINLSGRYFIGYITNGGDQGVSYSDDHGVTWHTSVACADGSSFNILDKNHLWVDNGPESPYKGNLYDAWMHNSGSPNPINIARSITNGTSWEADQSISNGTNAGSHNQGVNIKTGTNGEVYVAWSVYDSWPGDEKAIGFAKSLDGGITYSPAVRIINNIRGIRTTETSKNMRCNSFPSMTVDLSNGPRKGWIYIVWANIGVPGVNTGSDIDCYIIHSTDGGSTWTSPVKINQDPSGQGKEHYFPWIACDQTNGKLVVVFYDDRNVASNQCETFMAISDDGGATWEDMKVSDVAFTPSPIPLMASGYMGDYLGIDAYNGMAYPCWTDNRLGYCMTYVSPIEIVIPKSTIVYDAKTLNDATYGNNNGKMDFGETELLSLAMKNTGTKAADSVWVTLQTESPYITITDSTEYYGHFEINETVSKTDAYQFDVALNVPDGELIEFITKSVDAEDTVTYSNFFIEAHAPAVTILSMNISDPNGNNNGQFDPGETATVNILTQNTGEFDAVDAISELSSSNPFVQILNPVVDLGTLAPGQIVTAVFNVVINAYAAQGTATILHNYVHSIYQYDEEDWLEKLGLIVEDWETGDFTKFPWTFPGDGPWIIDPDTSWEGSYSAKNEYILDNQSASLELEYNVMYDDSISFIRKVSSQIFADKLNFFIDGNNIGSWNGNKDWLRIAAPVLAGPHTFRWDYTKDASGKQNRDRAWLDFIVFPPEAIPNIYAGDDDAICSGQTYQLQGLAINCDSLMWTTSGTGTFDFPTIMDPVYTPSSDDIAAGSVTLTLHAWLMGTEVLTDEMILTINPSPTVNAGPDESFCAGSTIEITGAAASGYTSLQWTTGGDGTFSDPTLLSPVYTPGIQDIQSGNVVLVLSALSGQACPPVTDSISLTIHALPVVDLGTDTAICANLTYTLDATTAGATGYLWYPTGETTPVIEADSTGVGYGTQLYIVLVTDINGCTGTDSVSITYKNCTGIEELKDIGIRIYPNPNTGVFTLEMTSPAKEVLKLRILNASGQPVYSVKNIEVKGTLSLPVDLNQLSQGSYLLELSNGKGILVRKLVIQR
jgi:hypothetical protein